MSLLSVVLIPILLNAQVDDSTKREIKLQGAFNFRDIGGYATKDGKHIKWGKMYRSADISKLTDEDVKKLTALAINNVFDFRGPMEVSKAPDRLPLTAIRTSLPAGSEQLGGDNAPMFKSMRVATSGDSIMLPYYANIESFEKRYKPIFDQLLIQPKDSAILFHCSAGKDRTGIFTALLLSVLDVDTAIIFQDYLASNFYSNNKNAAIKKMMIENFKIPEPVATDVLGVKTSYLQSTFTAINSQYGSIENYLKNVMGLDKKKMKKLKSLYLE